RTYDLVVPFNILNPFSIWLTVVLLVGISLSGYLMYKFLGRTAGIFLGGILGGAISSTATTFSYARRSREDARQKNASALVIFLASIVVCGRVLLEIAVVAGRHFWVLGMPVMVIMVVSAVAVLGVWLVTRREEAETSM